MTASIESSIKLDVPARTAYDQWTQFETFPQFMPSVEEVVQVDDRQLRWRLSLGGRSSEWTAEITEQIPDKRIAWRSLSGPVHAGCVTFHRLSDERSKVMFQVDFELDSVAEEFARGLVEQVMQDSLEGFKRFIEERGEETGAWRGRIRSKDEEG